MRALALVLPLLVACGHTEARQAMLRSAEAPTGRPVELYLAEQPLPARPFYEIALVQATGFGSEAHPEDLVRALTDRAGALGCDAVVRAFIDQGYSRSNATGVCVKWLAPGPVAAAPVLPPDLTGGKPPPIRPAPLPRIEPLPSAGPSQGGGR